ncbi:MAG TPA: hypothetical protein VHT29_12010 [Solirubrobacteraceae bacterium]|jgi:hypothetical protein|nr:hypothetical protein [Solirubrobacteraceae bacterium]
MPVDVEYCSLVLLSARGDEEIRNRKSVLTFLPELPVGANSGEDRLGIHPQVSESGEVRLDVDVVARTPRAVEHLEPGHRAKTYLPELKRLGCRSLEGRLISQQQAA